MIGIEFHELTGLLILSLVASFVVHFRAIINIPRPRLAGAHVQETHAQERRQGHAATTATFKPTAQRG